MQVIYNKQNNPFDEIKYIPYNNQLIVKKITDIYNYIYNFHLDICREKYVAMLKPGMSTLFNVNDGYYYVTINGTNEHNFELIFERMSEEQITHFNENNRENGNIRSTVGNLRSTVGNLRSITTCKSL